MSLDINIYDVIIGIINFILLYIILNKILFKPILKNMEKRDNLIKDAIEKNETKENDLKLLEQKIKIQQLESNENIQKLLFENRNKTEKEYKEKIEEARKIQNDMYNEADLKIKKERLKMIENSKQELVSLSMDIATKIIKEKITNEELENLTNKFIEEAKIND